MIILFFCIESKNTSYEWEVSSNYWVQDLWEAQVQYESGWLKMTPRLIRGWNRFLPINHMYLCQIRLKEHLDLGLLLVDWSLEPIPQALTCSSALLMEPHLVWRRRERKSFEAAGQPAGFPAQSSFFCKKEAGIHNDTRVLVDLTKDQTNIWRRVCGSE